jgi:hypothetical protein
MQDRADSQSRCPKNRSADHFKGGPFRRRFLTNPYLIAQTAFVSESDNKPLLGVVHWLSQYAGFPKSRLAVHAETLVLLSAAAKTLETEATSARPSFMVKSRDVARDAALRAHNERRKLAHYKCDNSAKV